jgi:hypothetical protein
MNGVNLGKQVGSYVTHYGVSFKDAFNKKSSLQTDNYGSVKLTTTAKAVSNQANNSHHYNGVLGKSTSIDH